MTRAYSVCLFSVRPRESGDPESKGRTYEALGPRFRGDEQRGLIHAKGMRGVMSEAAQ